jgi:hypothetical protein
MVYNNKLLESIRQTLFYANYRRYLNLFIRTFPSLKTEVAIATADELKEVYELLKQVLKKA